MRLRWHGDGEPTLGDLVYEALDDHLDLSCPLRRGFLVVGLEEGTDGPPKRWRVVLERLDWNDFLSRLDADATCWQFVRDRRR